MIGRSSELNSPGHEGRDIDSARISGLSSCDILKLSFFGCNDYFVLRERDKRQICKKLSMEDHRRSFVTAQCGWSNFEMMVVCLSAAHFCISPCNSRSECQHKLFPLFW